MCDGNNKKNSQALTHVHIWMLWRPLQKYATEPHCFHLCCTAPRSLCRTCKQLIKAEGFIRSNRVFVLRDYVRRPVRLQLSSRVSSVLPHALIRSNLFQNLSCSPFPVRSPFLSLPHCLLFNFILKFGFKKKKSQLNTFVCTHTWGRLFNWLASDSISTIISKALK